MLRGSGTHAASSSCFTRRSMSALALRSMVPNRSLYFSISSSALKVGPCWVVISVSLSQRDQRVIEIDHDVDGQIPFAARQVIRHLGVVLVGDPLQGILDILGDVVEVWSRGLEHAAGSHTKRVWIKDLDPEGDRAAQHRNAPLHHPGFAS